MLAVSACSTMPRNYEDERVIILDRRVWIKTDGLTADQIRTTSEEYMLPVLDDNERHAYKRLLWGQGADLATTVVAIAAGCTEANPLFAWAGGPGAVVAAFGAKLALAKIYLAEARKTPAAFSLAKTGSAAGAVGGAAAIWNIGVVL
ncbi:MAG: hypothetical protein AB7H19_12205, partial [Porticoccaceae bacterium]